MSVDGGVGWDGFAGVGLDEEVGAAARMRRRIKWSWGSGPWSSINCSGSSVSGRFRQNETIRGTDGSDFVAVLLPVVLGEGAEEEDDLSLEEERRVSSWI